MSENQIHGIIGYTITPFDSQDNVDTAAIKKSTNCMIENGVHAIAPLGSTGEGAYLSEAEWEQVAGTTIDCVDKRVPTIVSVSSLTTAQTIRNAKAAEKMGATAVMVLPISYWKLNESEILAHYRAVGEAINIPIMLYNNPGTAGVDMPVDLIMRIVKEVANVTMVKESTGDIQRMHQIHLRSNGEVPFYNGCNPMALEAFVAGATGWCTAAPNLIPALNCELYEATQAGELERARKLFYQQLPLLDFILSGGLPTTIKAGLELQGIPVGTPRLPVAPLDKTGCLQLKKLLEQVGEKAAG